MQKKSRLKKLKSVRGKFVQIPFRGIIGAGPLREAIEERETTITVPQSTLPFPNRNYYGLRVSGDSMIEKDINSGDTILIKNQNTAKNGDIVVALVDNTEATLKTFYREKNHIRLQPANNDFKPILVDKNTPIEIQGVFVSVIEKSKEGEPVTLDSTGKYRALPLDQIICGDVLTELKKIPDGSVGLIVTSPP